jgi:large subunit ribosomal protein L4
MASAKLFNLQGDEVGTVDLSDKVFAANAPEQLVHEVAVALQANQRQGNHETKTRTQVSGGGRKPYRQKGTGNARHGSTREPQMRGGGTVFGPHKRSYRKHVTIAAKRRALIGVLSARLRGDRLCVLESSQLDGPKTKPFVAMLARVSPSGRRTLFVTPEVNKNFMLSARNIPKVEVKTAADLNVLDVLTATQVVLVRDAVAKLEERLS